MHERREKVCVGRDAHMGRSHRMHAADGTVHASKDMIGRAIRAKAGTRAEVT